ncbi:MAG: DUF4097 domain-containing protein [Actinobacteria bacterium]|nr:DUF4097 domain-containing protein [Actinomycetota bacterium]
MRWGAAVAGAALIGVAVLLITGWVPWASKSAEQHAEIDAAVVRLDLGSGDVTVRRGGVERISLLAQARSWWGAPGQGWRRDGDAVVLGDCGWLCTVNYELVVPPKTRVVGTTESGSVTVDGAETVDVEVNSGSIDVSDVPGTVSASTNSGSVSLTRIGKLSTAHSSSGSINGHALAGPVVATTSSGDVTLDLARQQDVRAETSSGDVELAVPAGSYRVESPSLGTETDEERIEVVDDPNARYSLELSTSSGAVAVRQR